MRTSDGTAVFPTIPDILTVRDACRERSVVCPDCGAEVIPTSASVRMTARGVPCETRAHFKHRGGAAAEANCPGALMSARHFAAQANIAAALQRRHPDARMRLEAVHHNPSGETGRSDILLEPRSGAPLCVEVQASKIAVADLLERTRKRARDGFVVEWIFLVDRHDWTQPIKPLAMFKAVLEIRGYAYLLDDPMSDDPPLRVAVEPWISNEIPDLRGRARLRGHVHILRKVRPVSAFMLVGGTPGAAGLRCDGLHGALERWMTGSQRKLERVQPRSIPQRTVAIDRWEAEHQRLSHVLERTEMRLQSAQHALHAANTAATAATAAAAPPPPPPPQPPATPPAARRGRRWLRWLRPRPPEIDPIGLPPHPDAHHLAARERRASGARALVRERRDQLARAQTSHETADSAVAAHAALRAAAERLDHDHHAAASRAAANRLEEWRRTKRAGVEDALTALPTAVVHHRQPIPSTTTSRGRSAHRRLLRTDGQGQG